MLKINKLEVQILSEKSESLDDLYGFEFTFGKGLNIIAGPNSKGKTTINSCIYYCLGMEELLGAQNEKSLDKALKEEFTTELQTKEDNGEIEKINHPINYSKVYLEVENSKSEVVVLERYIKPSNNDVKTSNIVIYNSDLTTLKSENGSNTTQDVYYTNAQGNNEDPNGFYQWLKNFIDIVIPEVSNNSSKSNYSPLYLQSIFSALFIEQTKGWSDFFANMPFFGITKAKEKIMEFLLDLHEIKISTERDVLIKERNVLQDDWQRRLRSFSYLEQQSNSTIQNIPEQLSTDKSKIEQISLIYFKSEDEKISLRNYIEEKKVNLNELENKPLSKINESREETIQEYNKQKEEYASLKGYIESFREKFNIEKIQYDNLNKQLIFVEKEIKENLNLQKVFKENIINEKGANHCPTCSQEVSIDLLKSKEIQIPQLSLEENTSFLKSQKKIIKSSINSLEATIKEKKILLNYFQNNLRQKEILIKSISKDLIADDRAFNESEIVKKLQLEKEIESLNDVLETFEEIKEELKVLATKYYNNNIAINALANSAAQDEIIITEFESLFKKLLFDFGYDSNVDYKISINRKEPFKYFPVYKKYKDDSTPQSIRINSSASDFVRSIWAFTISLLELGKNHPGIIIFDEPGQHRTNMDSLKSLFKKCSELSNRQCFIFTSIDKQLNEDEEIDLDELLSDLNTDSYHLIRLDDNRKVIDKV